MAKKQEVEVMLVFGGKEYPANYADLNLPVEAHLASDADLIAAAAENAGLGASKVTGVTVKRPSSGRVLISGQATLG